MFDHDIFFASRREESRRSTQERVIFPESRLFRRRRGLAAKGETMCQSARDRGLFKDLLGQGGTSLDELTVLGLL